MGIVLICSNEPDRNILYNMLGNHEIALDINNDERLCFILWIDGKLYSKSTERTKENYPPIANLNNIEVITAGYRLENHDLKTLEPMKINRVTFPENYFGVQL